MDGTVSGPGAPAAAAASHSVIYDLAKADWDDRIRQVARQRRYATIAAGAATAIALAMAGIAYKAAQPRIETVVVEVDGLGDAVSTAIAPVVRPIDLTVARYQVAEFITNLRSIVGDPNGERRNINALFAMLLQPSPAAQQIAEYFGQGDNRPLVRATRETVVVEIQTVTVVGEHPGLPDAGADGTNTWRVEWIETARNRDGRQNYRRPYVATLVTTTTPPVTVAAAKANPTGLFVREISISEKGGRAGD